jgi:formylglycine-generating enzyme required for sulfatase activity
VPCEDKTCVGPSGEARCEGVCAPDQTQCSDNGLQTCDASGQYGAAVPCENKTCLAASGSASCQGACAPGQVQCSGNGVQACNALTGQYGSVMACVSAAPHCADGTCGQPSSCQSLTANCGPSSNESCCASTKVTGGAFDRINDASYRATVADFRLDKFEVTVGRWRTFQAAWSAGWRPTAGAGKHGHLNGGDGLTSSYIDRGFESGWDTNWASNVDTSDSARQAGGTFATWTASTGANENRPINYVNWYESYAFCIWDGGFLPSEAEWNYAAAGGGMGLEYPWGPAGPTCALADFLGSDGGSDVCYGTFTTDVGILDGGNGLYGQSDLVGNLWEWNLDWYAVDATAFLAPCNDCAYLPISSSLRVNRGGAFNTADTLLPNSFRNGGSPSSRTSNVGLRCARLP